MPNPAAIQEKDYFFTGAGAGAVVDSVVVDFTAVFLACFLPCFFSTLVVVVEVVEVVESVAGFWAANMEVPASANTGTNIAILRIIMVFLRTSTRVDVAANKRVPNLEET